MKSKSDYKLALEVVGNVIRAWDPNSLLAMGAPNDEFDSEIASVATQISRINSPQDAAHAISRVFSSAFEHKSFTPEDCAAVGAELFEALCDQRLV